MQANWQTRCFYIFSKDPNVKFASSRRLPELRARTARMHEDTVFTYRKKKGDATSADLAVCNEENELRLQYRYAVEVQDFFLTGSKVSLCCSL